MVAAGLPLSVVRGRPRPCPSLRPRWRASTAARRGAAAASRGAPGAGAFWGAGVALFWAAARAQPVAAGTARRPGRAPAFPADRPHTSAGALPALCGLAPLSLRREGPLSLRAKALFPGTTSHPAPPPAPPRRPARCLICTAPPRHTMAPPTALTAGTHTRARTVPTGRTRTPTRRHTRTRPTPAMGTEPATATDTATRRGATDTARSGLRSPVHHHTRAILMGTLFRVILNS